MGATHAFYRAELRAHTGSNKKSYKKLTNKKVMQLQIIQQQAQTCTACKLHEQRTNVVFGQGPSNADILIIGEGPGKNEDEQGLPFVGKAGQNLTQHLKDAGLKREEVYITNIVKCRPPNNRDPQPDEYTTCTQKWLMDQIETINPKFICPLGNYASKFILAHCDPEKIKSMPGITQTHGKQTEIIFRNKSYKVFPLFHPAALIYNRKLIPEMQKDLEKLKGFLQQRTLG